MSYTGALRVMPCPEARYPAPGGLSPNVDRFRTFGFAVTNVAAR